VVSLAAVYHVWFFYKSSSMHDAEIFTVPTNLGCLRSSSCC
jgi:hypothetical protein